MTDSVAVFPPGQRLTNSSTGAPLSGAVVRFYTAGTTTPKTVYADADLTVALGTSVTTDSLGYPTSDGTTKTLVYTDTSAYKARIETSGGSLIVEHDNVKGAVTSGTGSTTVVSTRTVETKSLDYTVLAADQGKAFAGNCSGGDVIFTLPSAAASDVGNGWLITICHAGSANQVVISTVSSQTITSGVTSYAASLPLSFSGEEVTLISDGGNWRVFSHVGPNLKSGSTVLTITDRLASAPGAPPAEGAAYIATGAATWGSVSVAEHDVVVHTTGGAYVKFTPPSDCGWLAYVQDEDLYYSFVGSAWAAEHTRFAATQSDQETATSTSKFVTPAVQQHHPGHPKFWALVSVSAGTPTLTTSYNVTSITDTNTGQLTVTIATDFANANWACFVSLGAGSAQTIIGQVDTTSKAAGSVLLFSDNTGGGAEDPVQWNVCGFGDQA